MKPAARPRREIRCPGCDGTSVYDVGNPYRPFCSARCKTTDFGAWASGEYAVPTAPTAADDEDATGQEHLRQ